MPLEGWEDLHVLAESLAQAAVTGILMGGLFALMSVGLGLIFGMMRVINFAQPEFMMLGMYAAFFTVAALGGMGFAGPFLTPVIGAAAAAIAVGLFGWLVHRLLLSRVRGERAQDTQIILTLGVSLLLQNGALMAFGADPLTIRTPISARAWTVGEVFVNQAKSLACLVSVACAAGLYLFMSRSRLGRAMRAAADNPEAATYMGIDVARAQRTGFALGIALTAAAGGMVAMFTPFQPYVGLDFLILMYASVVLGGLGSINAAFWGGMTIGLVQQLSSVFVPIQLQNMVVFVAFLLIVILRPNGLFGRSAERI